MENLSSTRPTTPQKSQSFSRLDSPRSSPLARSRANTLQNGAIREEMVPEVPLGMTGNSGQEDIYEKNSLICGEEGSVRSLRAMESPIDMPEGFDELPIEIISLIDRFIESLSAKVHNTPPSIEKLSDIFQDFYLNAESSIATHISALSTKQSRGASPNPSISSKSSGVGLRSIAKKDTADSLGSATPEQQMLTPQEISERRRARRMLDRKGIALEEAVERRICEKVYKRIWRHRSTLDEVRDEKLRSRTAALALVGIGLKDLGITFDTWDQPGKSQAVIESEIEGWISRARDGLLRMNDARYPLGKLQQLAAAHRNIVDLLTALHQSSSSADEILPTLIYTLITTPPEGINVISNLHFIQRFRAASKVDGEAAYCLVNLEAAITFLETVDLASLRADEALEGPPKSASRPTTPLNELRTEWLPQAPTSAPRSTSSPGTIRITSSGKPLPNPGHSPLHSPGLQQPSHNRRLSNLFQPPASALGAASDAVRNTADQGFKTIGNTLDSSFNLLFGRLREQKVAGEGADANGAIIVPKTLDDVAKLVEPKAHDDSHDDDDAAAAQDSAANSLKSDDSLTLLSAIAGRKAQPARDRSVDSANSVGSAGKKVAFASTSAERVSAVGTSATEPTNAGIAAVESMRSLGNSLNPLRGFGGMGRFPAFGRSSSSGTPTPTLSTTTATATGTAASGERARQAQVHPSREDDEAGLPPVKIAPPIARFLDVDGVGELRVGEVEVLLMDYRRLARALEGAGVL